MYLAIILILLFVAVLILYLFHAYSRAQSHNRIRNYRNLSNQKVQSHKMIIAIQLIGIFVDISQTSSHGFIELEVERKGLNKYLHCVWKWLGRDVLYYKVKDRSHNIAFIQTLLATRKVQLYLYTNQTELITNALLKKLGLCKYFKESQRRYRDQSSKEKKHPTQIDSETRRVIILTGSKDYSSEDSKYFLIMKKNDLRRYGRELSELIRRNEDIDDFHTEFVAWKMGHCGYDSSQQ